MGMAVVRARNRTLGRSQNPGPGRSRSRSPIRAQGRSTIEWCCPSASPPLTVLALRVREQLAAVEVFQENAAFNVTALLGLCWTAWGKVLGLRVRLSRLLVRDVHANWDVAGGAWDAPISSLSHWRGRN